MLRIYNTGAGLGHHEAKMVNNRIKYRPYVDFFISNKKIINDKLAEIIFDIGKSDHSNSSDIYRYFVSLFERVNNKDRETNNDKIFITKQRSGSCVMSSLHILILDSVFGATNKDIFEKFKFVLGLNLLNYQLEHESFEFKINNGPFEVKKLNAACSTKLKRSFSENEKKRNNYSYNEIGFDIENYNIDLYEKIIKYLQKLNYKLFKENEDNYIYFSNKIKFMLELYNKKIVIL